MKVSVWGVPVERELLNMSAAMLAAAPSALQCCCVASTSGRAPTGGAPLPGLSKRGARNFRAEQLGCRYSFKHAAWFSGPALQCSTTSSGAANLELFIWLLPSCSLN